MEIESQQKHWLILHEKITKRVRKIASLLAVLFVIALTDGFNHIENINKQIEARNNFLKMLPKDSEYRKRARKLYVEYEPEKSFIRIPLSQIEDLSAEMSNHLTQKFPEERRTIWGFRVSFAPYAIALIIGPSFLLLLLLIYACKIRKLHKILQPSAVEDGEIQQKLNSLFHERVTKYYSEGWKKHVSLFAIALIFFALLAPTVFFSTIGGMSLPSQFIINAYGDISTPGVYYFNRGDESRNIFFLVVALFSLLIWSLFFVKVLKICKHKKNPNSHNDRTTNPFKNILESLKYNLKNPKNKMRNK